jgi:cyclohexyl-isocyanide hydratase
MDAAFCVFDGMTTLDFVGAYDPITRLEGRSGPAVECDVCARSDSVAADGLRLTVDRVEPDLGAYDLLFVPGGFATRDLRHDEGFLDWLRSGDDCEYLTSVCTGSLLLGAAGFLEGKTATTHPDAVDLLDEYATVSDHRVVRDGNVITARGVTASVDFGLYVVELLSDAETRAAIATQMDYPYGRDVFPSG